jgi:ribosomal protein S18 acetylase RimI-like enzyme
MPDDNSPLQIEMDKARVLGELGQLAALFRASDFRELPTETLRQIVEGSTWVVAAWEGQALVGFARALTDGVSNGYITSVCVLPSHQRRGIGRRLMLALMGEHVHIKFVLHSSEAGEALYRSLGFVEGTRYFLRDRIS